MDAEMPEVVRTASDAAGSKLSAVKLGYYEDEYLRAMDPPTRKRPTIINRGTYARAMAVEAVCRAFLEGCPAGDGQLVLLGAGRDSLFFRLAAKGVPMAKCLLVDAHSVSSATAAFLAASEIHAEALGLAPADKTQNISAKERNHGAVEEKDQNGGEKDQNGGEKDQNGGEKDQFPGEKDQFPGGKDPFSGGGLVAHATAHGPVAARRFGARLTVAAADVTVPEQLAGALEAGGLSPSRPTVFLAECVLAYLEPGPAEALVRSCGSYGETSAFVAFDMVNPHDPFGRMMLRNLRGSGLRLPGLEACPSLEAQAARLAGGSYPQTSVASMLRVYDGFFAPEERGRVAKVEWLDEVEEWNLIMSHYSLSVGAKGDAFAGVLASLAPPLGAGAIRVPLQAPRGGARGGAAAAP